MNELMIEYEATQESEETEMPRAKLSPEARQKKIDRDIVYNANNITRLHIALNNHTDADIIAYLDTIPNKQGLVKGLLRASMTADGFKYETET